MKVGISISGGAAKSISALGVLHGLQELGLSPEILVGSSGGALVSTMFSAGFAPKDQLKMVMKAGAKTYLKATWTTGGWFSMRGAEKVYRHYLGESTFADLEQELHINCTDLLSGRPVVFSEGPVIPPLMASTSIPGLYPPRKIGPYLLTDGSISDNLPGHFIRDKVDILIGILTIGRAFKGDKPSVRQVLQRSSEIALLEHALWRAKDCDILLRPKRLDEFKLFSISRGQELFDLGLRCVEDNETALVALRDGLK